MRLPHLIPRVVYGHRRDVRNNAHFITDVDVIYASGAYIVIQNTETFSQKYLILQEKACYLTRLAVSPQRTYFAALISTETTSVIHIYDSATLKRKRSLSLPSEATTKLFESLCFSYDERLIMVITGHPDWMMLVYNWERGKVESSTKANLLTNPMAPVKEIVCSPVDTSVLLMFGQGLFRLMNMQETVWRQYGFQKAENFDITSCCFLTGDRILCGTDDGLLLLIELAELKFIFEAEVVNYIHAKADKQEELVGVVTSSMLLKRAMDIEEEEEKRERAVRALTPLSRGFTYACGSVVYFFEKIALHKYKKRNEYEIIPEKEFRENQSVKIHTVIHLTVNNSETEMIATTRRSQLYVVKLWEMEMDIAGRTPFKHLWLSIHHGRIGDLAVCLWKPIFMTCGTVDRTLRVWNYLTNKLEMMKQYEEDIHSVSLHPTGLYAAIGFSDKLRFMIVLINDLQVCRELPIRECPKSSFNVYGHLLAAVNRNTIQIYNIITFQNVANLKGHRDSITCLQWTKDDMKLISCGMDGAIYEWDMNTFKRIGEIVHKGLSYFECAILSNGKNIFAVGGGNKIKEFKASNMLRSIKVQGNKVNHVVVSRSNLLMFIGSLEGWLMAIKMPIEEPLEYEITNIHAWEVAQMKLTMDDRTLITCSNSGTISVWNLESPDEQPFTTEKEIDYFKEILISKTDLEEKIANIKDLTQRTFELEMEHAYQRRHIDTVHKEKIKEIHSVYQEALTELKGTFDVFEAKHITELNNINSDINVMKERHDTEILELEAKYNAELIVQYNKVQKLENVRETLMKDYKSKLDILQTSKEKTIEELTRVNESKLYNLNKMVEEAQEENNKEVAEHAEITRQMEDDNDIEIEALKKQCSKALKAARESNMRLKGECGVLKKKIISCEKEKNRFQMEIIYVAGENERLKQTIKSTKEEILDLKKEVGERDLRIEDKEKRIYDLKRKDQQYERYTFVLNCKIKELKNRIEPMDREIKERKEHIAKMEVELFELHKINLSLDNKLSMMREKLGNAYKSLHSKKSKYINVMHLIKRVKSDIFAASGNLQNNKNLKNSIQKLYVKYITDREFKTSRKGDAECIAELKLQKQYLEGIVSNLDKNVQISKYIPYGQQMNYMEMNWSIMDDINHIRKKLRTIQKKTNEIKTLVCVRLTKDVTPMQAHKIIQKALNPGEPVEEECKINMKEATNKVAMLKEEVDSLVIRISKLERSTLALVGSHRRKETVHVHVDIPSDI